MKRFGYFLAVLLFVFSSTFALASNPADVTSFDRFSGIPFFKATYEGGPRSGFACFPVAKNMDLTMYNWQDEEGEYRSTKLKFITRLLPKMDISFLGKDVNDNGAGSVYHTVALDIRPFDFLGLGTIVPLQKGEELQLGVRASLRNIPWVNDSAILKESTVYVSRQEKSNIVYGISYSNFLTVDTSLKRDFISQSWEKELRVSKGLGSDIGTFVPEIRIKIVNSEEDIDRFVGCGLGFIPKWN